MDDKATTIQKLKDLTAKFRDERGWEDSNLKDGALSLVLEASEVLELFQWIESREVESNPKLKKAVAEELADVLWWVITLSQRMELDLTKEYLEKMESRAKKYPLDLFGKNIDKSLRRKAYYAIKAKTRGGHPLAE